MGLFSFLFGNSGDDWFDTGRTETRDEGTADVKYSIQRNSRTGETRLKKKEIWVYRDDNCYHPWAQCTEEELKDIIIHGRDDVDL